MLTPACTCSPRGTTACSTCLWFDALIAAAELGALGADCARLFRAPGPEINLRALLRRVALLERAVGLGRLSNFV